MSVQDNFLFDGGHYEVSIPKQGIEGAAGDPQVIGGLHYCLAGGGQQAESATAGSGRNTGGRGVGIPLP